MIQLIGRRYEGIMGGISVNFPGKSGKGVSGFNDTHMRDIRGLLVLQTQAHVVRHIFHQYGIQGSPQGLSLVVKERIAYVGGFQATFKGKLSPLDQQIAGFVDRPVHVVAIFEEFIHLLLDRRPSAASCSGQCISHQGSVQGQLQGHLLRIRQGIVRFSATGIDGLFGIEPIHMPTAPAFGVDQKREGFPRPGTIRFGESCDLELCDFLGAVHNALALCFLFENFEDLLHAGLHQLLFIGYEGRRTGVRTRCGTSFIIIHHRPNDQLFDFYCHKIRLLYFFESTIGQLHLFHDHRAAVGIQLRQRPFDRVGLLEEIADQGVPGFVEDRYQDIFEA